MIGLSAMGDVDLGLSSIKILSLFYLSTYPTAHMVKQRDARIVGIYSGRVLLKTGGSSMGRS